MSENDLVVRAAATGDVAAFGALVRRHQSKVRAFLLRVTHGDGALADDLAQETFVAAWRKIAQFRGEGSFLSWLHGIAYSRFLMDRRKRKTESIEEIGEPAAPDTMPASLARIDLEKAMAKLRAEERAALTLCYALEYTHEEAARIMNLPLGTLKSHVTRGREKLHAMLGATS